MEHGKEKSCLAVDELRKLLGISKASAYALCRRDGFPAVRVSPRRIIIPIDALEEWLKANAGV